ncbi:MAG TPA: hypothetical protein PLV87_17395, partial [Opitutaceae bacterium]|nr:hypothetical protein [Opitutaceae bacterium]
MSTRRHFLTQGATLLGAALIRPALAAPAHSGSRILPIPTATGEILPGDMGITSLHEHIALPRGDH